MKDNLTMIDWENGALVSSVLDLIRIHILSFIRMHDKWWILTMVRDWYSLAAASCAAMSSGFDSILIRNGGEVVFWL